MWVFHSDSPCIRRKHLWCSNIYFQNILGSFIKLFTHPVWKETLKVFAELPFLIWNFSRFTINLFSQSILVLLYIYIICISGFLLKLFHKRNLAIETCQTIKIAVGRRTIKRCPSFIQGGVKWLMKDPKYFENKSLNGQYRGNKTFTLIVNWQLRFGRGLSK